MSGDYRTPCTLPSLHITASKQQNLYCKEKPENDSISLMWFSRVKQYAFPFPRVETLQLPSQLTSCPSIYGHEQNTGNSHYRMTCYYFVPHLVAVGSSFVLKMLWKHKKLMICLERSPPHSSMPTSNERRHKQTTCFVLYWSPDSEEYPGIQF